jgi:hypothetical protein
MNVSPHTNSEPSINGRPAFSCTHSNHAGANSFKIRKVGQVLCDETFHEKWSVTQTAECWEEMVGRRDKAAFRQDRKQVGQLLKLRLDGDTHTHTRTHTHTHTHSPPVLIQKEGWLPTAS